MGFQFRHGDQEVRLEHGLWEVAGLLQVGKMATQPERSHIVIIQVYITAFCIL